MATHDLKNPLTSIGGMSQILQLRLGQVDEPSRDRFAHSLRTIEAAACRMTTQISESLDYAQVQTVRPLDLSLDLEPTDVVALLRQVLEEHQRATERHTLELAERGRDDRGYGRPSLIRARDRQYPGQRDQVQSAGRPHSRLRRSGSRT